MTIACSLGRTGAACALFLAAFSAEAGGPLPIARIAPARSFFVAEVGDVSAVKAAVERSPMGEMWRDRSVQGFVEHLVEAPLKALTDHLATIDAKTEDLVWPTGRLGIAAYMPAVEPGAAPDQDAPAEPHVLIVGEFGEQAGRFRDLMSRFLDKALDEKRVEITDDEYQGTAIHVIKPVRRDDDAPGPQEGGGDAEAFEPQPGMTDRIAEGLRNPPDVFQAWIDSTLVVASDLASVEAAIDAAAGRPTEAVESSEVFKRSLAQHGGDPLAYAIVLTGPLAQDFTRSVAEGMSVPVDPTPILEMFGLRAVEAVSLSLRALDAPDALAEVGVAVLAHEKTGLMALLAGPLGGFAPPAFVGPDTASVLSMTFKFDGLFDTLRAGVQAMPPDDREGAAASIEQAAAMVGPALAQLGPRVHVFSSYARPLGPESQRSVYAIEVKEDAPVRAGLDLLSKFGGLQPRDFEGQTIYSGDRLPIAAGLGFGHVFFGAPAAVENAMRAAGNPEAPRLAGEEAFRRDTAGVPGDAMLASFADLKQELQWVYYTMQNFDQIQAAALEGIDLPPEQKDEILKSLREDRPDWVDHLPSLDVLTRALGSAVYEIHPTTDGFEGRLRLLRAP